MSRFTSLSLITVAATLVLSTLAVAQEMASARDIMEERQDNYETMGESFKTIRDQLRSGNADMDAIDEAAQTIARLAPKIKTWFPEGTGPGTGIETEAKAEIWENKDEFNAAADKLEEESKAFAELTATGDPSKVMGGIRSLGGACKNCHDQFRVDDDE